MNRQVEKTSKLVPSLDCPSICPGYNTPSYLRGFLVFRLHAVGRVRNFLPICSLLKEVSVLQTLGKLPTLTIQKTDGCQVYLSRESLDAEIVSSKSSEMNIIVPDPSGEFVCPCPHSFCKKIKEDCVTRKEDRRESAFWFHCVHGLKSQSV